MKNDYVVKKIYHSFVMVSILAVLTATAGMLIDNIIVGQFLGTNALGAMGVVSSVGIVFSVIGSMFSSGGSAQAAQAIGRGDKEKLNRLFSAALLSAVLLSGIVMVFGVIFAPQIASALGGRDELAAPAAEYLRGYFLGAIPTIILPTLNSFAKIDGSTKMPLISIAVMSVADIILDLAMVLVFKQGMFGMALATTLSYCIAVAVTLTHFTKKSHALRFTAPKKIKDELKSIVSSGAPTAISRICITFETAIFNNLLVISVGAGAVAAMNVRTQANNLIGSITLGVSQALMPIAGMFFGEEDSSALKGAVRATFKLGMILSITAAVLLFMVAPVFAKLLGVSDSEILDMASIAVRVFAIGMPIQLFNLIWMNFYQSTKRIGMATMICILETFVYAILAAFVLIRPLGSNGVWLAFLVGEVLTMLTLYIYVACKNKKLLPGLSDYMLLDNDFGVEGKQRWDLSIGNDIEQVVTLSNAITEYGKKVSLDPHMLNALALCIEEMAGNVVKHAFSPGEKRWFDLMILNKEDSVIVRMRDNGREFDPLRYLHESGDPEKEKLGIRLISALSDEFEYRRAIGLNNLIIIINKKYEGSGKGTKLKQ